MITIIQITDLYDLSYMLSLIRNDIKFSYNSLILENIIKAINNKNDSYQPNNIRKYVSQIEELMDERWAFIKVQNYYTKSPTIIKDERVNELLSSLLCNLLFLIESSKYEQAYELADIAHAIPEILVDFNGKITKSFWENRIKLYAKRWNDYFLNEFKKSFILRWR